MMKKIVSIISATFMVFSFLFSSSLPAFSISVSDENVVQSALDALTYDDNLEQADIANAVNAALNGTSLTWEWEIPFARKYSIPGCTIYYPDGQGDMVNKTINGADGYIMGRIALSSGETIVLDKTIPHTMEQYTYNSVIARDELYTTEDGALAAIAETAKTKEVLCITSDITAIYKEVFNGTYVSTTGTTIWGDNAIKCIVFEDRNDSVVLTTEVFQYMDKLETVFFCDEQTNLAQNSSNIVKGGYIFAGCHNLKYVRLSDELAVLGDGMFYNCTSLEGLVLPSKLQKIGNWTLARTKLKEVTLSKQMDYLGYAFNNMSDLKRITVLNPLLDLQSEPNGSMHSFMNIGSAVVRLPNNSQIAADIFELAENGVAISINTQLFDTNLSESMIAWRSCIELLKIDADTTVEDVSGILEAEALSTVISPVVQSFTKTMSQDGKNVTISFVLNASYGTSSYSIACAIVGESGLSTKVKNALELLAFNDNLTKEQIETSINSVLSGTNVTWTWEQSFARKYSIPGCYVVYPDGQGGVKQAVVEGADGYIVGQIRLSTGDLIVIDKTISHTMENYTFTSRIATDELVVNESGTIIGMTDSARTKDVLVISEDIAAINADVFNGSSDTAWGNNNIQCIIFENRVSSVDLAVGAFKYMDDLKVAVFCDAQTDLAQVGTEGIKGGNLFRGCSSLKYVRLSKDLTILNDELFYNCTALEGLVLPNGLEKLANWTLARTKLKEVTLPSSLNYLGFAFNNMSDLHQITVLNPNLGISQGSNGALHSFMNIGTAVIRLPADSQIFEDLELLAVEGVNITLNTQVFDPNLSEDTVFLRGVLRGLDIDGDTKQSDLVNTLNLFRLNGNTAISVENFWVTVPTASRAGQIRLTLITSTGSNIYRANVSFNLLQLYDDSTENPILDLSEYDNKPSVDTSGLMAGLTSTYTDAAALTMKQNIWNAVSSYNITGTTYYVSNDGNDANSGTTPEQAWKTIDHVNTIMLNSGDAVLFRRGDIFRSSTNELVTHEGVTYGAYGVGDKPCLYASSENAVALNWMPYQENIWVCEKTYDLDVGSIIFNHGENIGNRKLFSLAQVTQNYDFYYSSGTGKIYLYLSEGNPSNVFYDIEIAVYQHFIRLRSNMTVDNLCIKYCGSHALVSNGPVTNVKITNCEIGWIGGALPNTNVRYGNAIQFWGPTSNCDVISNYIYQIWDTAITPQFTGSYTETVNYSDMNIKNNIIEYCSTMYEYFLSQDETDEGCFRNITVEGNMGRFMGYGWGSQRITNNVNYGINAISGHNNSVNYQIRNNVIDQVYNGHVIDIRVQESTSLPTLTGNTFIQKRHDSFGYWVVKSQPNAVSQIIFNDDIALTLAERGIDNSAIIRFID